MEASASPTRSASVEVVVMSLAGSLLAQLQKPRATTLGHLKTLIEHSSGIPACEQRLMQLEGSEEILADHVRLEDFNVDGSVGLSLVRVPKRWAVTGDFSGSLCVWDLDQLLLEKVLETRSPLSALAVDWSSRLALCGSSTGELGLWDLGRGCCLRELRCSASTSSVLPLPAAPSKPSTSKTSSISSCSTTASCSGSCSCSLPSSSSSSSSSTPSSSSSSSCSCCCPSRPSGGRVRCVELDWQNRLATSVSVGERCARLWDLNNGRCIQELLESGVNISHISTDWHHMLCLTGGEEGTLCLWDLQSGTCIWRQHCYRALRHLSLDWGNLRCLVVGIPTAAEVGGNASGVVIDLWTFETAATAESPSHSRQTLQSVPGPSHAPLHLRPDQHWSRFLKLAGGHSRACLSELLLPGLPLGEEERQAPAEASSKDIDFEEAASCLTWGSDETSILAGGTSGMVWLVDAESCSIAAELEGHRDAVTCLAAS